MGSMIVQKNSGKAVKAFQLDGDSSEFFDMYEAGKIRQTVDGDYYLLSQESYNSAVEDVKEELGPSATEEEISKAIDEYIVSGEAVVDYGEEAKSGDYFKIDSSGYPYPNEKQWFERNHKPVDIENNQYEQIPQPLEAWEVGRGDNEVISWLVENGRLKIDENNKDAYFSANLWGSDLTSPSDSVVIFYGVDRDREGNIQDVDFNFVARDEFDRTYSQGPGDIDIGEDLEPCTTHIENRDGEVTLVVGTRGARTVLDTNFIKDHLDVDEEGYGHVTKIAFDGEVVVGVEPVFGVIPPLPNLKTVDCEGLDTSKVTEASHLFLGHDNLERIENLGYLDVSNCTSMTGFAAGCPKLKELDMSDMDLSSIRTITNLCAEDASLKSVKLPNSLKPWYLDAAFLNCKGLETLDLTPVDVSDALSTVELFAGCENLKDVTLSTWKFDRLLYADSMFEDCKSLESDLRYLDFSHKSDNENMLYGANPKFVKLNKKAFDSSFEKGRFFSLEVPSGLVDKRGLVAVVDLPQASLMLDEAKSDAVVDFIKLRVPSIAVSQSRDNPDVSNLKLCRGMTYTAMNPELDDKWSLEAEEIREDYETYLQVKDSPMTKDYEDYLDKLFNVQTTEEKQDDGPEL